MIGFPAANPEPLGAEFTELDIFERVGFFPLKDLGVHDIEVVSDGAEGLTLTNRDWRIFLYSARSN